MASFISSRRSFVGALAAVAGAPLAVGQPPPRPAASDWDMTWLDRVKAKHKQIFDLGSFDLSIDTPLRVPTNYLDSFRDVYRLAPPEVAVAVGVSRIAFPINASDALWQTFALGERWDIKDPATGKPSTRNIFLGASGGGDAATIRGLQARGALFWQCNVALGAVAFQLSRAVNRPMADVRAELVAGLLPGVVLVPSHAMAVALVQERGFTYMKE
jgi:hypothetical protein